MSRLFALALSALLAGSAAAAAEPHAAAWLTEMTATRDAIVAARGDRAGPAVFLVFWDFDGTILRGDCSEGSAEGATPVYAGLAQRCIEAGLSQTYPASGGFERFWADYRYMDEHVGHWLAYPFIPQMLRGAPVADVRTVAERAFAEDFASDYLVSSVTLLRGLEAAGVENHILSASADVFVDAAAATLGLPVSRCDGIQVRIDAKGRLTSEVEAPVTWSEGKLARLLQIVAARHALAPAADIYVLGAFGNSFGTDGPFLEYVARQTLPAGRPVVGIFNGGAAPERYRGVFREVAQRETVGASRP